MVFGSLLSYSPPLPSTPSALPTSEHIHPSVTAIGHGGSAGQTAIGLCQDKECEDWRRIVILVLLPYTQSLANTSLAAAPRSKAACTYTERVESQGCPRQVDATKDKNKAESGRVECSPPPAFKCCSDPFTVWNLSHPRKDTRILKIGHLFYNSLITSDVHLV